MIGLTTWVPEGGAWGTGRAFAEVEKLSELDSARGAARGSHLGYCFILVFLEFDFTSLRGAFCFARSAEARQGRAEARLALLLNL